MNFRHLVSLFLALILSATAVQALDQLRIGVTKKVDPAECERKTKRGDVIDMHYEGRLDDGTVFDSSYTRGDPLQFTLGVGQVIQGWDQGLTNMCIGEKRKLTIPSHLAYGDRGVGPIPPKATLIFETELVGIQGAPLVNDEL